MEKLIEKKEPYHKRGTSGRKTYLVRAFGKAEYESYIEINFLRQPELKQIFSGELSGDEIYKRMTATIPGIKMIPGRTMIFLDEIQKCASARAALKFMVEDGRFDLIASGSLLGLSYGLDADAEVEKVVSIPVGYEIPIEMYSLDFEEFLWANGYSNDTGLLMSLFGFSAKLAVLNDTLKGFAKGGIYENFVAQTLIKNGYTLHYYRTGDDSELEFVIEKNGEVIPVEVKAGNTATKSLNRFIEQFEPSVAYKIMGGNAGVADGKLPIPHYMAMFI